MAKAKLLQAPTQVPEIKPAVPKPKVDGGKLKEAHSLLLRRNLGQQEKLRRLKSLKELERFHESKGKGVLVTPPERIVGDARRRKTNAKQLKRAKAFFYNPCRVVQAAKPMLLAVRVPDTKVCTESLQMLKALKLQKPNSAMFVSRTPEHMRMLKILGGVLSFGSPSVEQIDSLVRTRLRLAPEGSLVTGNVMVEEAFASAGILCVEDLVYEICSNGSHFGEVWEKLLPFQVDSIKKIDKVSYTFTSGEKEAAEFSAMFENIFV